LLRRNQNAAEVLLLRRTGSLGGIWCQVAGKIEPEERAWQSAVREVYEETRISVEELWSADVCEQFYDSARECITLVPVFVTWVPDTAEIVLNDEHDSFKWVGFDEADTLLSFPGQRRVLAFVKSTFVDREPNPHLRIDLN